MGEFFKKLQERFVGLSTQHKVIIAVVVFLILATFIVVFTVVSKTEYTVLFRGLTEKEAGIILAEIDKIPEFKGKAKLLEGGTRIDVPVLDKAKIKIALASGDLLPKSTKGWEIFDKTSFVGITDKEFNIKRLRALTGNIEQTLKEFEKVKSAKVNLTIAPKEVFEEDQKESKASVILMLEPFKKLTLEEIRGMRRVVAYSVVGLEERNVIIQDTTGKVWTDLLDEDDSEVGLLSTQTKLKRAEEKNLKKKIYTYLERLCGPGKVVVDVSIDMDFDKKEESMTTYAAPVITEDGEQKSLILSQNNLLEQYKGQGINPVGVPGTTSNIPGYKEVDKNLSDYKRVEDTTNYLNNQKNIKHIYAPGVIKRITVSVLIDETKEIFEKKYMPIDPQLKDAVKNLMGFNPNRGDSISIYASPFNKDHIKAQERELRLREKRKRMIWYTILIFMLIIALALAVSFYYKKKREAEARRLKEELMNKQIRDEEIAMEPVLSPEEQEKIEKQERIKQYAKDNPEAVSQLLRLMLNEEH